FSYWMTKYLSLDSNAKDFLLLSNYTESGTIFANLLNCDDSFYNELSLDHFNNVRNQWLEQYLSWSHSYGGEYLYGNSIYSDGYGKLFFLSPDPELSYKLIEKNSRPSKFCKDDCFWFDDAKHHVYVLKSKLNFHYRENQKIMYNPQ